jgi:DMSO/TMAO reductase YedYZ molybdopterin-dependent catalytic subunit
MPSKSGPSIIPASQYRRRTVLEWLGKATVLAIGGELLAACASDGSGSAPAPGRTGSPIIDAGCEPADFPFSPGAELHEAYDSWNVRTVDEQDLVEILGSWSLTVDGLVETPVTLSFAEILELQRQDQVTDFHCVEGWSVRDVPWNGVHFSTIFDLVQPLGSATHLTFTSVGDVYTESLPIDVALEPHTILGYGVDCNTLPLNHGFPLRIVIPRKFGYKNAKYVYRITLADAPIQGFWEQYGYGYDADVPEDRLREGKY